MMAAIMLELRVRSQVELIHNQIVATANRLLRDEFAYAALVPAIKPHGDGRAAACSVEGRRIG